MYLFGGTSAEIINHYFYSLELNHLKWEAIASRGEQPLIRDEHTAVVYEDSMIIFAGFEDGIRTNSMYRYYFLENKWEKVNVLSTISPVARAGHSTIMFGDKMTVFGGRDDDNNKLNDIWIFDFST